MGSYVSRLLGCMGTNGATNMSHNHRETSSDNLYKIEPMEARRLLSVSASEGEAAVEESVPEVTEEYTDETYETTSDEVVITCDGIGGEGEWMEIEILTMAGGDEGTVVDDGSVLDDGSIIDENGN